MKHTSEGMLRGGGGHGVHDIPTAMIKEGGGGVYLLIVNVSD